MGYIDQTFYDEVYQGDPVDPEAFRKLEARSSDLIDMLTNYKLLGVDLESQPLLIKMNVKKAVAAQIEYLSNNGESVLHGSSDLANVKVGNFSYSESGTSESLSREQRRTSPAVISYLVPTGLLYSGVCVHG